MIGLWCPRCLLLGLWTILYLVRARSAIGSFAGITVASINPLGKLQSQWESKRSIWSSKPQNNRDASKFISPQYPAQCKSIKLFTFLPTSSGMRPVNLHCGSVWKVLTGRHKKRDCAINQWSEELPPPEWHTKRLCSIRHDLVCLTAMYPLHAIHTHLQLVWWRDVHERIWCRCRETTSSAYFLLKSCQCSSQILAASSLRLWDTRAQECLQTWALTRTDAALSDQRFQDVLYTTL